MDTDIVLDETLDERIAVLRRYRRMLELQREGLQDYLVIIDTREVAVAAGDYDGLEEYTAREQQAVKNIMSVQRCLEPLADMYRRVTPEGSPDIEELHDRLENLRVRILERNEQSRIILKSHLESLRGQIDAIKIPRRPVSPYARTSDPSMIDIQG